MNFHEHLLFVANKKLKHYALSEKKKEIKALRDVGYVCVILVVYNRCFLIHCDFVQTYRIFLYVYSKTLKLISSLSV